MQFFKAHSFPLVVAAGWLFAVWALVLVTQALHGAPLSLAAWAGDWDGGWYRSIVERGYYAGPLTAQQNVAFFPLYPLVVWMVHTLTFLPVVWAGMLVSVVSFAAALVVVYTWARAAFGRNVARWAVLLLACNPFSFYFGMMYTEALFVLLAASTFLFVWRHQWWRAALMAGLASGTRSVGVGLGVMVTMSYVMYRLGLDWGPVTQDSSPQVLAGVPAARLRVPLLPATPSFSLRVIRRTERLLRRVAPGFAGLEGFLFPIGRLWRSMESHFTPFVEGFSPNKWDPKKRTKAEFPTAGVNPQGRQSLVRAYGGLNLVGFCILAFSGLLAFSLYLYLHTGDAIAYSHAQQFWPGRGTNSIGSELHYLFAHKVVNKEYFLMLMWYICAVFGVVGLWLLLKMRQYVLAVFAGIALSLPFIYGTAMAVNRYLQVIVPIYIAYAWVLQPWPRWAKAGVVGLGVAGMAIMLFIMTGADHPFLG